MPHIIVEYSPEADLDIPHLLRNLHGELSTKETVSLASIKTRAIPVESTFVGEEATPNLMVHITVKLLPGRSDDLKRSMAMGLRDAALPYLGEKKINLSVEVVDLHKESYIQN